MNEYLYEQGFDFVYDIIVASGGNTSPYRRWHTDKVIREGDLVIVDQNAVGPGGYFVDFVRCFKVGGRWTEKEKDLYKECYESMYAAIEQMKAGNTTADVAAKLPKYADDEYGTVTLQQFAHSIGLSLYEGMWISRAYSLDYPVELEEDMYFAAETFAGHPGLEQTVRLEENLLVTKDGPVLFTKHPFYDEALAWPTSAWRARSSSPTTSSPASTSSARCSSRSVPSSCWRQSTDEETLVELAGDADAMLVCYAQIAERGRRGGGRRRLPDHLPLRDRLRQHRRRRPRPSRHPRHVRARLLPRRGRRPRDRPAAGAGAGGRPRGARRSRR